MMYIYLKSDIYKDRIYLVVVVVVVVFACKDMYNDVMMYDVTMSADS